MRRALALVAMVSWTACVGEPDIDLRHPCDPAERAVDSRTGFPVGCTWGPDAALILDGAARPAALHDTSPGSDAAPSRQRDAGEARDAALTRDAASQMDPEPPRDAAAPRDMAPRPLLVGFLLIEPGVFEMGSTAEDPEREDDETLHRVTIRHRFWLKRTEVTRGEWRALMGTEPWATNCAGDGCPVENVNWSEVAAWTNARSQAEGLEGCYHLDGCNANRPGEDMRCGVVSEVGIDCMGYRLPTEAEWEFAARAGGQDRRYPWGDEPASCARAVMNESGSLGCGTGGAQPVCSRPEAPAGLCDMAGNVWEWVEDWYGPYGEAPNDGRARTEPYEGRVYRGGGWSGDPSGQRAAYRRGIPPTTGTATSGFVPPGQFLDPRPPQDPQLSTMLTHEPGATSRRHKHRWSDT